MPESFAQYLAVGFRDDISTWFETSRLAPRYFCTPCALISSDGRGLKHPGETATLPFKVASMYACVLTHAAVAVTKEPDVLYAMSKVLGFPLIDQLMAGYVNPMTALEITELLPTDQEKESFFDLAHEVYDQVRDLVIHICRENEPKLKAEEYVQYAVGPKTDELMAITTSYLMDMEKYLKGESEKRPSLPSIKE